MGAIKKNIHRFYISVGDHSKIELLPLAAINSI